MTDPTAHWSPSEVDDPNGSLASYPPPAPSSVHHYAEAFRVVTDEGGEGAVDVVSVAEWMALAAEGAATTRGATTLREAAVEAAVEWGIVEIVPPGQPTRAEMRAAAERDLAATEAEARTALDALRKRCDAAEAEVGRLRTELAAAEPVLLLDAIRRGTVGVSTCAACDAAWPDGDNCPSCGFPSYPDKTPALGVADDIAFPEPERRPVTASHVEHRTAPRFAEAFEGDAPPDADRSRLASPPPRVVFLYRPKELDPGEREAASRHFVMAESRLDVRAGDVVIARHFAWPWPRELFDDLRRVGARPVNDARGHAYAADLLAWTADLGDLCPAATDRFETLPERGPFIVKGEKADKGRWSRMFAETKADAIRLRSELMSDSGMRNATIVARQYVALAPLGDAPVPGACPPSVEFRVFVAFGRVLSAGYYWPPEDCDAALLAASPRPEDIPADFLAEAIARVSPRVDFFTLDVGVDCDGRWWVIEVSDGLRAGMSDNDPAAVYAGLAAAIVAHYGDAATPDRDLCPTCGALDLDHAPEECARRWAAEHPYAAGAMHGGIAHRSEVKK